MNNLSNSTSAALIKIYKNKIEEQRNLIDFYEREIKKNIKGAPTSNVSTIKSDTNERK